MGGVSLSAFLIASRGLLSDPGTAAYFTLLYFTNGWIAVYSMQMYDLAKQILLSGIRVVNSFHSILGSTFQQPLPVHPISLPGLQVV